MSHPQVVVHIPGSAAGIGCRGSCARGRRDCQEPSLQHPWMVWAAAGSAPGFILLRWVTGAPLPVNGAAAGPGPLPLTSVFFFSTGFVSGGKVEFGMVSNEALWAFCLLFHQLLLVLFCDLRIWNFSMKKWARGILQAKSEQILIRFKQSDKSKL